MQGNNINKRISAIETDNNVNFKKNMHNIESHRDLIKSNINELNKEKDKLLDKDNKRGED